MSKLHFLRASMLCMAALMGAEAVSARAGGNSASVLAGRPAEFKVLPLAAINSVEQPLFHMLMTAQGAAKKVQSMDSDLIVSGSLFLTLWFSPTSPMGENDTHYVENGDKEKDHPTARVPDPPTILSLGAALVIGGGVLFLRRLRGDRK
jgi:hypothetical protein